MKNKIWNSFEILTEEHNISISPTEEWDGIVVSIKEMDGVTVNKTGNIYLNEDEIDLLYQRMKEMVKYVKS